MIMKNKKKIAFIIVETWLIICWKFNGKSQHPEMYTKTFEKQDKEFHLMENRNNYFGID